MKRYQIVLLSVTVVLTLFTTACIPQDDVDANTSPVTELAQSLFTTQVPARTGLRDGVNYELGMRFKVSTPGTIQSVRFYKSPGESGAHTGKIYSSSGAVLAQVTFLGETASGWQTQNLASPLSIAANTGYVVSVNTGNQYYVATNWGLSSTITNGSISSLASPNGVYGPVGQKPTQSYQGSNYFRDIVFVAGGGGTTDTTRPTAPGNPTASVVSSSQINLAWSASTDNVGVTSYAVERCVGNACTNFAQVASVPGLSHSSTGLSASTTYRFRVRAADAAGNSSPYSSIVSATTQSIAWPKTDSAGVPAGVTLTNYTGPMLVTADNTLIENKIINGTLTVRGRNVTVRNSRIQNFSWYGIMQDVDNGSTNLRVENCDIDGTGSSRTTGVAIGGGNSTLIGSDIRGMVIAVKVWGAVQIRDNYIHHLAETSSNPDDRHFDGISLLGGGDSVIDNNAIIMPAPNGGTAAVFMTTQQGNITNVTVNNNLLMGDASYTLYAIEEGGQMSGITITNNYVDRGIYGHMYIAGHTPVMSGNVLWNDGVEPTPAPVQAWKNLP